MPKRVFSTVPVAVTLSLSVTAPIVPADGSPKEPFASHRAQNSNPARQDASPRADSQTPSPDMIHPQLPDGTLVRLKFLRAVDSSQVIAGEKIPLEVVQPVVVGKIIAIPQRSPAEAIVTLAQPKRSMARGGNLELKIENIHLADGELVPLRGVKDVQGQSHDRVATGVVAAAMVVPAFPLIYVIHGKNATIAAGAEIDAFIAGNVSLDAARFQSIPADSKEKTAPR